MHLNQESRNPCPPQTCAQDGSATGLAADASRETETSGNELASHGNAGRCRRRTVQMRYPFPVTLTVDFDREEDGRWIALVESIPGCQVYGETREEALTKVEALALHAIAEKLEDGEVTAEEATNVSFVVSAAA
jgi:predicted RNase H-like HicB family nuclease